MPFRCAFLPALLRFPPGPRPPRWGASALLSAAVFQHLFDHPAVALLDPAEGSDPSGPLLCAGQPGFAAQVAARFRDDRRDECLWFEIDLGPKANLPVQLCARLRDGGARVFSAGATLPLWKALESCLAQWLAARDLAEPGRRFERFSLELLIERALLLERMAAPKGPERALSASDGVLPAREPSPGEALAAPFAQVLLACTGDAGPAARVHAHDPSNPWALGESVALAAAAAPAEGPLAAELIEGLHHCLREAPHHAAPWLILLGEAQAPADRLDALGAAAMLLPGDAAVASGHAVALLATGRAAEAAREARRALHLAPLDLQAHSALLEALQETGPIRELLLQAEASVDALDEAVRRGQLASDDPALCRVRLARSSACLLAGRQEEAVRTRAAALEEAGKNASRFRAQRAELEKWRSSPQLLSLCYLRAQHQRRDPGRALAGAGLAGPLRGDDAAGFAGDLLALGEEEVALLALERRGPGRRSPRELLVQARVLLANQQLGPALERIETAQLAFPQAELASEVNRLLRIAAARPAPEWEAAVADRLSRGASRLARNLARDAADFAGPFPARGPIALALGGSAARLFTVRWLLPLREALAPTCGAAALDRVEAFLGAHEENSLLCADALAQDWPEALRARIVPALAFPTAPPSEAAAEAACTLHLLAHALCRYLSLCTQQPGPLAGGLRQVATDALLRLARLEGAREVCGNRSLHALLGALEQCAAPEGRSPRSSLDPWLLDGWLLRLTRALSLEERWAGELERMLSGLPTLSSLLRGGERIGFELRLARQLPGEGRRGAQAARLFERCVRSIGAPLAQAWSRAAKALPSEQAIDVHWTARAAAPEDESIADALGPLLEQGRSTEPSRRRKADPRLLLREARLAALIGRTPQAWEAVAAGAAQLGDDEAAADASERALALSGEELDPSALARFFNLLFAMARYQRAEEVARRWMKAAGAEAGAGAWAADALARALLGQGRSREAIVFAEMARRLAPPSAARSFMQTLEQCRNGPPLPPATTEPARIQAARALALGDFAGARAAAAIERSTRVFAVLRLSLAAVEPRAENEPLSNIAQAALRTLPPLLALTAGAHDLDAALLRARALKLREDALLGLDPPAPPDSPLSEERFAALLEHRAETVELPPVGRGARPPQS